MKVLCPKEGVLPDAKPDIDCPNAGALACPKAGALACPKAGALACPKAGVVDANSGDD